MKKYNPLINFDEDGLMLPEVGFWGKEKYKHVGNYCNIFTSAMKGKWDNLVYIDLFAGAGAAKIKGTSMSVMSSALIALNLPNPFTHYIFCEADSERFDALKKRTQNEKYQNFRIDYLEGDSNKNVDLIVEKLKQIKKQGSMLTFCFVDPFSLNLHFESIKKMANHKVDFLILLALQMDARRNLTYYKNEENTKIDDFLNRTDWRSDFKKIKAEKDFIKYISDTYDKNMISLGYQLPADKSLISNAITGLYYLAFYSKHPLGNNFFKKIQRSSTNQLTFDF